jgi:hypothetical protein
MISIKQEVLLKDDTNVNKADITDLCDLLSKVYLMKCTFFYYI